MPVLLLLIDKCQNLFLRQAAIAANLNSIALGMEEARYGWYSVVLAELSDFLGGVSWTLGMKEVDSPVFFFGHSS